jgi:hypothetical protein
MYGSESRALSRDNEESFSFLEWKVFQRIFGPACENVLWHVGHNSE